MLKLVADSYDAMTCRKCGEHKPATSFCSGKSRVCKACHAEFQHSSPSIDRIIPELGYVRGNIAVISMRANKLKSDATSEELERISAWMRSVGAK